MFKGVLNILGKTLFCQELDEMIDITFMSAAFNVMYAKYEA